MYVVGGWGQEETINVGIDDDNVSLIVRGKSEGTVTFKNVKQK